mmetsp:Transcript_231/g.278  ORF Transcript_231/g.278 Transcript_231/m.278 type:complete len:262 (+) Transcript_231:29-814(+)|eukprot:CAMPEP_0114353460 /NCGR_PEP_ID=MMETSP0101-20121206/18681_1 /TAXON_ID=38822 ORGANISM="Pteridomonas danica, Strain PT" /NCGR_SAMPLE_ID=MMETSP0101 /ASSEMBLY_ACC=CAM_ASM_000211 /LENGTH=261 /DNA_ID=CAMNT_0001494309 /DNA_START=22 /DNA_END=807 /DNA_ORIENTATION=+
MAATVEELNIEAFDGLKVSKTDEEPEHNPNIEELDLSAWEGKNRFAIVVHNVFTPEECQALIQRSEDQGYEAALVNIGGGRQIKMDDVRTSDRCIIDDPKFAEELWSRIRKTTNDDPRLLCPSWCPKSKKAGSQFRAVGLNERLRFLRYDKGNFFASHMDGAYFRNNEAGEERKGERSLVTCQLYLNEGFEGGATRFGYDDIGFDVVPKTGSVLLFEHQLTHEGSLLIKGRKYAIRTDVMYTNKGEDLEYAVKPIVLQNQN